LKLRSDETSETGGVVAGKANRIDTNNLFYHYLQKELLNRDIWLFQMLISRMIIDLGIWLHPAVYQRFPIVLPFAVRDPLSRGSKKLGLPDAWGAPNSEGYFRDDNSLIKGLPRALPVTSCRKAFSNKKVGPGFVAAHVWRELGSGELASRNPLTYSFVPNVVWLPTEVAALTDREGSFAQTYVQAIAHKIYRGHSVVPALTGIAEQCWSLLPTPTAIPEQGLPDVAALNYFVPNETWAKTRLETILSVAGALGHVRQGKPVTGKVVSSRYGDGLQHLKPSNVRDLQKLLQRFV
jgi:hypothetical protein